MDLVGVCRVCGKETRGNRNLFCANYAHSRGGLMPCLGTWCGRCYKADPEVPFWVLEAEDDEGHLWKRRKRGNRFLTARDGDSFMCHFQCDVCVFRNLQKRDPRGDSEQDKLLMACLRRVILDAFWARESSTVESHGQALRRSLKFTEELGLGNSIYAEPGLAELEDHCGYGVAALTVLASWSLGHYSDYTQFETI